MMGYYDYVLGLIPLTLLGLTGLLVLSGMGVTTAVPLGAGVSGLVVGHALFINGPVDATETAGTTMPAQPEMADTTAPTPEQA